MKAQDIRGKQEEAGKALHSAYQVTGQAVAPPLLVNYTCLTVRMQP